MTSTLTRRLLDVPAGRTLIHLETVIDTLDLNEDSALELVEDHKIAWAFNIAGPESKRREIRVWRESFVAYLAQLDDVGATRTIYSADELDYVIEDILPNLCGQPERLVTIRGKELQRRFSCSQWLVKDLIVANELATANIPGPKESPAITYQSAAAFLKRRAL